MAAQHHGGNAHLLGARRRQPGAQGLHRRTVRMPERPGAPLPLPGNRERLRQRGERQRRCRLGAAAKAKRQHRLPRQFTEQRDVAGPGCVVLPGQCAVAGKVLPAIAAADESRAGAAPGVLLPRVDGGEGQPEGTLLRPQQLVAAVLHDCRAVVGAGAAQVRCEQRVGAQRRIAVEGDLDEQHITMLARCHTQREIEALVVVHDVHRGRAGRGEPQLVLPQALHLDPEARAVADDETQVADLRDVNARVIDLVDDAAADGEPQARVTERAADHFLGAAAPGRRQSGRSRSRAHRPTAARSPGRRSRPSPRRQSRRPPMNASRLSP